MNLGIKDVFRQIRLFFVVYIILFCACIIIKLLFTRDQIFFAVNSHNYPWADFLAPFFTDLGYGWAAIILSAIIALFNYRGAFLMVTSWGVTSILAQVVKYIFDEPRPRVYFAGQLSHIHFVKGIDILRYHSFPSGHTVTAFSAAVVASYLVKNKNLSPLFLLLAALIGYSRMYLSEHFFGDVIAGSVFGVLLTVFWLTWLDSKKFLHKAGWGKGLIKSKA